MYLAFCGHSVGDPSSNNVDLYIALSKDGGQTYLPGDTLHLTDAMLNLPNPHGTAQMRPSIAVDVCGGVNLFYYQHVISSVDQSGHVHHTYSPRFLRIPSFPATGNLFHYTLGSSFTIDDGEYMGDYDRMAAAGNFVYVPHTSKDADGSWNVYLNTVTTYCVVADVNDDAVLDVTDVTLYANWYVNTDVRSDLNGDGVIDFADFALFLNSYSCGCNPQQ